MSWLGASQIVAALFLSGCALGPSVAIRSPQVETPAMDRNGVFSNWVAAVLTDAVNGSIPRCGRQIQEAEILKGDPEWYSSDPITVRRRDEMRAVHQRIFGQPLSQPSGLSQISYWELAGPAPPMRPDLGLSQAWVGQDVHGGATISVAWLAKAGVGPVLVERPHRALAPLSQVNGWFSLHHLAVMPDNVPAIPLTEWTRFVNNMVGPLVQSIHTASWCAGPRFQSVEVVVYSRERTLDPSRSKVCLVIHAQPALPTPMQIDANAPLAPKSHLKEL